MDKKYFCLKCFVRVGILIMLFVGAPNCFADASLQKVKAQSDSEQLEIYTNGIWNFCVVDEKEKYVEINGFVAGKESECIKDGCLTIPSSIKKDVLFGLISEEYKVVGIAKRIREDEDGIDYFNAFQQMTTFTSVSIPEGVTYIGDYSFCDCSTVKSVTLPQSLRSIGDGAFGKCEQLESIVLPENLETLGESCFRQSGLTSVTIPGKVKAIPGDAFYGCTALKSIILPEKLEELGEKALPANEGLVITIPEKLTDISKLNLIGLSGVTFHVVAGGDVAVYLTQNNITYTTYESSVQKPTEATTETKTEATTETKTEAATETKTEAATETKTEATTETKTEATTETKTEATTETKTEATTETKTEATTETKTEATTEMKPEATTEIKPEATTEIKSETTAETATETTTAAEDKNQPVKQETPTQQPANENESTTKPAENEQQEEKIEIKEGNTYTVGGLKYKVLSGKQVSFAGAEDKLKTTIKIPATVKLADKSYKVVRIEKRACKGYKMLKTVTVGKNVSTINDEAFMNCKSLKYITFGTGTTVIGKRVLKGDKNLKKIVIKSKKLKKIGKGTFSGIQFKGKNKTIIQVPKSKNQKIKKAYKRIINQAR